MSYYTVEQWTIKNVADAFLQEGDANNRKVVIPIFQRGFRWEEKRRAEFIDSLLRGYPFGALLFAKQGANTYAVVDGLQRGSTVCDYVCSPLSKTNLSTIDETVLDGIRNALFPGNMNKTINDRIEEYLLDYCEKTKRFEDIDTLTIINGLMDNFPTQESTRTCQNNINSVLIGFIKSIKNQYEKICSAMVPIIVYSGPENLLSEIFNRINTNGKPLNDFEIYAAVWGQEKRVVNNADVVQKVVNKYVSLTNKNFELDGFDANSMLQNKKLTAFEFLFGLGKYWNNKFSCLNFTVNEDLNVVSEISFEIVDACINDTKDIANLHKKLFTLDINKLQRRIEEAIKFVENSIAVVSEFKGNKRKTTILHSKYQIISLIAFTFRQMYSIDNLETKKTSWHKIENKMDKLIRTHYVADIILNEWHDGGAGKVYTCLRDERYLDDISKQRWITILDGYYQTQLSNKQSTRFSSPSNRDAVILNCIYLNLFSANDQLSNIKFDIEHLATKGKMKKLIGRYSDCKLPVSCIANYCYLPETVNREKKDKVIYEAANLSMPISEIETKFSFTKQSDFDWIFLDYSNLQQSDFEKNYYKYLDDRYAVMKDKFLNSMA